MIDLKTAETEWPYVKHKADAFVDGTLDNETLNVKETVRWMRDFIETLRTNGGNEKEIEDLNETIRDLEYEVSDKESEIWDLEGEISELQDEIKSLKAELDRKKS